MPLIALEGIDGAGKSTHAASLADWLRRNNHSAIVRHEPTDGPYGRRLRESASSGRLPVEDELELFLKDRRQHVDEVIRPALEAGDFVVLDRYYFSTMAYQGCRGMDPAEIRARNEEFAPRPDLLLILDLDVDAALGRIRARGDIANEFERRDSLVCCRDIFLSLVAEPFVKVIRAGDGVEAVEARVREAVSTSGLLGV